MNTNTDLIQIKGLRDGLLVTLGAGEWGELQNMLFAQIDERSTFFQGARLALDLGDQILRVAEMSKLRDELSEREISLWAVVSESPKTKMLHFGFRAHSAPGRVSNIMVTLLLWEMLIRAQRLLPRGV